MPNLKPNCSFSLLLVSGAMVFLCPDIVAVTKTWTFEWGTHLGEDPGGGSYMPDAPLGADTSPLASVMQYLYDIGGTKLATSGSGDSYTGDLIELGFFDTDGTIDGGSYTPNEDHTDLFKGVWTPLTSNTKIGRDWAATNVDAGEFYFSTKFTLETTSPNALINNYSLTNSTDGNSLAFDYLGDNSNNPNAYENRLNAITDDTLIGIRFYDNTAASSGVARYNTIMDSAWDFGASGNSLSLHEADGSATRSTLAFEFDNSSASAASKVGTGDNAIVSDDFTATITYYDGSSNMDLSDGSHILSGLSGNGNITLGDDGTDVYTLHANAGNAYTFSGNIYDSSSNTAHSKIIKTGGGEQIITGDFKLGGSTGGLVIQDGKITFAGPGASGGIVPKLQSITSASGGSPVLELNNTSSGASQLVTIGLSETGSADYGGSVVLNGSGSETNIRVTATTPTYTATDYNRTQVFSGVVSSTASNKLVKSGVGELELSGNNTFTGGVEIDDGTLIAGHANALGASNTVTITKGKLEVENGVTLAPTTITAGDSEKTMIGGRGTLNKAVTIGGGSGEIDVISAGDGISSSLSSSSTQQQVSLGDRSNAIGTFTISNTLTLESGGVFDWEVSDFTGSAGTDWDLLKFDTLNFDTTSDTFTINIMGLAADGTAGAMAGGNVWGSYQTSSGFKFMEATGNGSGWSGTGALGAGTVSQFTVVDQGWSYYNSHHLHEWSVWHDGSGAFYLQYSAVPEPSTYMMVTGLLMVPGMSYLRRIRRKKGSDQEETSL